MTVRRTICLTACAVIGAAFVTLGTVAAHAGPKETRMQLHRSFSAAESCIFLHAPWLLRLLAPTATSSEREVWAFLLRELSTSRHGPLPVAVDSVTLWPKLEANKSPLLFVRIAEGSANDPGDSAYAAAIHDFIFRNSRSVAIPSAELPSNVRAIPLKTLDAQDQGQSGWNNFTTRNNVQAYVTLSRVGFTVAGDRALVYVQFLCGPLCGHGAYYVLAKRAGVWSIVGDHVNWVS